MPEFHQTKSLVFWDPHTNPWLKNGLNQNYYGLIILKYKHVREGISNE